MKDAWGLFSSRFRFGFRPYPKRAYRGCFRLDDTGAGRRPAPVHAPGIVQTESVSAWAVLPSSRTAVESAFWLALVGDAT